MTNKLADYLLFKEAVNLIKNKEHLTNKGIENIVGLKASLNLGLTDDLKNDFSTITPVTRPSVDNSNPKFNPEWVAGFASGDGSFRVNIFKSPSSQVGHVVRLTFTISQHSRDIELMKSLITYLECGGIAIDSRGSMMGDLVVTKFSDIYEKIIPIFRQYKIVGVKSLDFDNWCEIADLIKVKAHLTKEGFDIIKEKKAIMNKGREDE